MHTDESLHTFRPPTSGGSIPSGIKPPAFAAKDTAMPGGVPPMFANPDARPAAAVRSDALEH